MLQPAESPQRYYSSQEDLVGKRLAWYYNSIIPVHRECCGWLQVKREEEIKRPEVSDNLLQGKQSKPIPTK
jgi:hypothetical protein